jgi:hypothetical protein
MAYGTVPLDAPSESHPTPCSAKTAYEQCASSTFSKRGTRRKLPRADPAAVFPCPQSLSQTSDPPSRPQSLASTIRPCFGKGLHPCCRHAQFAIRAAQRVPSHLGANQHYAQPVLWRQVPSLTGIDFSRPQPSCAERRREQSTSERSCLKM